MLAFIDYEAQEVFFDKDSSQLEVNPQELKNKILRFLKLRPNNYEIDNPQTTFHETIAKSKVAVQAKIVPE